MTKERKQMDKQIVIKGSQHFPKLLGTLGIELIFILFDGKAQEMAIVVQHDAKNGNTAQRL